MVPPLIRANDLRGLVHDELLDKAVRVLNLLVRQRIGDSLGLTCFHNPIRATEKGYMPGAWICSHCAADLDVTSIEKRYDIRAASNL